MVARSPTIYHINGANGGGEVVGGQNAKGENKFTVASHDRGVGPVPTT